MSGFQCPYCSSVMSVTAGTHSRFYPSFEYPNDYCNSQVEYNDSTLQLDFYKCPSCGQYSISVKGKGAAVSDVDVHIRPMSNAKQYPDYIPAPIRSDYEEACAIISLSPKASATLSRRCLQGMIRDFWGISKPRLIDEIVALQGNIPAQQWTVIDSLRRLGNIGAHMEKDINLIVDIEPDEAYKLIQLVELLIEQWYIDRHEQELLYKSILNIDASKQTARQK